MTGESMLPGGTEENHDIRYQATGRDVKAAPPEYEAVVPTTETLFLFEGVWRLASVVTVLVSYGRVSETTCTRSDFHLFSEKLGRLRVTTLNFLPDKKFSIKFLHFWHLL